MVVEKTTSRWRTGLLLLGIVILLWVGSGFMVNGMADGYSKPYLITYTNTGTFTIYLVPYAIRYLRGRWSERQGGYRSIGEQAEANSGYQFTVKETAILGAQFAIIWFTSNLLNNASYIYTNVASATIIACTSSFFTLILGVIFKIETFSYHKVVALVVSFTGVVLISRADSRDETAPPNALLGNLYALLSAFAYGGYAIMLKAKVGDESRMDTRLFFGFVGLFSIVLLWPVLLFFHWIGVERIELPDTQFLWTLLIINAVSTIISDYLWVVAMLMTSPLVVTVGLSVTIPLSMIGDFFIRGHLGSLVYYIGAIMVCWSFFAINKEEESESEQAVMQAEEPSLA
ncbi:thiamine-repressible mitochondrial transport protein Thi74p [Trichomonascus vanleenenianus]|uniref:uncharacterized protein n=1 Tax=Trichomonascus vanleenenianus TaxID=2268995 RepID=UPI003ECB8AD3